MAKCETCNKDLGVRLDRNSGQAIPNTKYWRERNGVIQYFCDAQCSLDLHEAERTILKLNNLGDDHGDKSV